MSVVSIFFKSRYSVELKSSATQLLDDFGEFPPSPLHGEKLDMTFSLIGVRGLGRVYLDFRETASLMRSINYDLDSTTSDFKAYFYSSGLQEWCRLTRKLGRLKVAIDPIFLICVMALKIVGYVSSGKLGPRKRNYLGYFFPLSKSSPAIVVRSDVEHNGRRSAVVSHEHIHFLQSLSSENYSRYVRTPERFLDKRKIADQHLLYILEKNEVEARLHEVVLSFYRTHRQLPVTFRGFLGLLAANDSLGDYVEMLLNFSEVCFDPRERYSTRDVDFVLELESVWMYIETTENQCRFITEVLPVMYGNLLLYYGGKEVGKRYLEEVARPNFYDELYGGECAAS